MELTRFLEPRLFAALPEVVKYFRFTQGVHRLPEAFVLKRAQLVVFG